MDPSEDVTVTETDKTFLQRQGNACLSMCMGCAVVLVLPALVFFNETNYVREMATADLIKDAVPVRDCAAHLQNDDELVYVTGCEATQPNLAGDLPQVLQELFPRGLEGASVEWRLEIMQWERVCHKESTTEKTNTGGTHTVTTETCEDERGWKSSVVTSSLKSHENHGDFPDNLKGDAVSAPPGSIYFSAAKGSPDGAFWADSELVSQFPTRPVRVEQVTSQRDSWQNQGAAGRLSSSMLRVTGNGQLQTGSAIGDIQITITGAWVTRPSIAAMQVSEGRSTFEAFPPKRFNFWGQTTKPLERLADKRMTQSEFIAQYKAENTFLVWLLRVIGLVIMCAGCKCIFEPLSVSADLLRILNYCTCCIGTALDNASQCLINTVSCTLACMCFMCVFILAWLFANPSYAVGGAVVMLACAVIFGVALRTQAKQARGRDAMLQEAMLQPSPPPQRFKVVVGP